MAPKVFDYSKVDSAAPVVAGGSDSTWGGNAMALLSPVADAGVKGFMAIPDLAGMALNGIISDQPYRETMGGKTAGEWLADALNPKDEEYSNLMAQSSPLARSTGKGLGAAENLIADPASKLMKAKTLLKLAGANVVADQLPRAFISSNTKEGQESQDAWSEGTKLATNVGAAVPDTVRLVAKVAPSVLKGVAKVGEYIPGVSFGKDLFQNYITGGNKDLLNVVKKTPEELTKIYGGERLASKYPATPENAEAMSRAMVDATIDSVGDSNVGEAFGAAKTAERLKLANQAENAGLGTAPSKLNSLSPEEVGSAFRDDHVAAYATEKKASDAVFDALPDPRLTKTQMKTLRGYAKDLRTSLRSVVGADYEAKVEVPQIVKKMTSEVATYGMPKTPPTMKDLKYLKESLEIVSSKAKGGQKEKLAQMIDGIKQLVPQEMRDAWEQYEGFQSRWRPETLPGKMIEHIRDSTVKPTSGAKVVRELSSSTNHDSDVFDGVSSIIGPDRTAAYFRKAMGKNVSDDLAQAGSSSLKGGEVKDPSILENPDFGRRVYQSDLDAISSIIADNKKTAAIRATAKEMRPGMPDDIGLGSGGSENSGIGSKNMLGTGIFGYLRPGAWMRKLYKNKMSEVERQIYNQHAPKIGLPLAENPISIMPEIGARGASVGLGNNMANVILGDPPPESSQPKKLKTLLAGPGKTISFKDLVRSKKKVNTMSTESDSLAGRLRDSVISAESAGNPKAVSPKGAKGIMQLMPLAIEDAAKALGKDHKKVDVFDENQNKELGTKFLSQQLDRFGMDPRLALAAYNHGPTAVARLRKEYGNSYEDIEPHLPKETRDYVPKVMGHYGEG